MQLRAGWRRAYRTVLVTTTTGEAQGPCDLGWAGRDDRFGYGLVDPVAALNGEVPLIGRNPLDDESSPGVAGFGSAPGPAVEGAATGRLGQFGQPTTGSGARWAARPAGGQDDHASEQLWSGAALFIALVSDTVMVVRRLRRQRQ